MEKQLTMQLIDEIGKEAEKGTILSLIAYRVGVSEGTFYKWLRCGRALMQGKQPSCYRRNTEMKALTVHLVQTFIKARETHEKNSAKLIRKLAADDEEAREFLLKYEGGEVNESRKKAKTDTATNHTS